MKLPFRQVHLDFHTSPDISGIGSKFDAVEFADVLEKAYVNSITIFARCHHGLMYYPSELNKERIHPQLAEQDLLGKQIKELHKRGIKAPIYTTVQWDEFTAKMHPEWLVEDEYGKHDQSVYKAGFYNHLCLSSPYRDFLKAHTRELFSMYDVDGMFYDIVSVTDCSCKWCRHNMSEQGIDASVKENRLKYRTEVVRSFKKEMTDLVKELDPNSTVFYNQGHVSPDIRFALDSYSHLELESLPSGLWGYDHFPSVAYYTRVLGKEYLGMTGKFHTSWADFHSYKNREALEFEVFRSIALNGKVSIGDQLHPNGEISQETYQLIGSVYKRVAELEAWCVNAQAVTDIGVFNPEEKLNYFSWDKQSKIIGGVIKILSDGNHSFDIIDSACDFSKYKLLILPDEILITDKLAKLLDNYVKQGGKILGSYYSGLDYSNKNFVSTIFDLKYEGDATFSPDYIVPNELLSCGLQAQEYVMYKKATKVSLTNEDSEILARVNGSYFNRTWEHYCSHAHTPSSGKDAGYPAVVRFKNSIYFAHPVFSQYAANAPQWVKKIVLNAIDILLPQPLIKLKGPNSLTANLNTQGDNFVLHLLYYVPESKSDDLLIIEDIIPLYNIEVSLKLDKDISTVKIVPSGEELSFTRNGDYIQFIVPRLEGYQVLEIK